MTRITPTGNPVSQVAGHPGEPVDVEAKEEKKTRRRAPKVDKLTHPCLLGPATDENGNPRDQERLQVKVVPDDFSAKLHEPFTRADFIGDGDYLRHRADGFKVKSEQLYAEARLADKMGSRSDRAKAKQLKKMQEKMGELRQQLIDAGINIDELED